MKRRAVLLGVLLGAAAALLPRTGSTQQAAVPAQLQAELIARLASHDRSFADRAGSTALVLIVTAPKDAQSAVSAAAMKSAFGGLDRVGGLPHREEVIPFDGAEALAKRCATDHVAIVYLTPGLGERMASIGGALAGGNVLSVAALPEHVTTGAVLGFELVSGKPKILLNITQARRQNVDFNADVMKLMRIHR